jgi:hypothetical protein
MTRSFIACLTLTLSFAATSTGYATEAETPYESLSNGDSVTGPLRLGRRVVAIPEGRWQLVVKQVRPVSVDGRGQMGNIVRLYFQEVRENRLNRVMEIVFTPYSSTIDWLDDPCKAKGDSYWLDDKKRSFNDQFCTRVGFYSGVVDEAHGADFEKWGHGIRSAGIGYSPEMPYVVVTRFTRSDFLMIAMHFDPASSGINAAAQPRSQSPWSARNLVDGSKQARFYESLTKWAPQFSGAVSRAFNGDATLRSLDYGEPDLPKP